MTIQYKFFAIPAKGSSQAEGELNKFLRSARVLNINREVTITGNSPMWCFAVEYLPGPSDRAGTDEKGSRRRIDYREVLAPEEFALFAKLREWRKKAAAKDAVPVYTIFTNEQLARIATNRITTKSGLLEIEGVGEAKVNKYGDEVHHAVMNICEPCLLLSLIQSFPDDKIIAYRVKIEINNHRNNSPECIKMKDHMLS